MENPNKQEQQNDKITVQNVEGIEPLNDSEELDIESLEEIDAAGGCIIRTPKFCGVNWDKQ